jgi:hypothetical protein
VQVAEADDDVDIWVDEDETELDWEVDDDIVLVEEELDVEREVDKPCVFDAVEEEEEEEDPHAGRVLANRI